MFVVTKKGSEPPHVEAGAPNLISPPENIFSAPLRFVDTGKGSEPPHE